MGLLNILSDFNCDYNWVETLENIESSVLDYNEAIAEQLNPGAFIDALLPVYWRIVREHNTYRWGDANRLPSNSQYDVGIFLVGFSSLPIVLSIAEIQPHQQIYFLHSPETRAKCDEITGRITGMLQNPPTPFECLIASDDGKELIDRVTNATRCEIANPSDPVEIFKQIKEIVDEIRGDLGAKTLIALDLTGGKKTMIGGGFTAGSIYSLSPKCDMFYVDSSEYDSDRGAPKPGTEFLSRLDNPYDVYNVQSVREAKTLFKEHNYKGAERLWRSVRDKLDYHAERYHFLKDERTEATKYYGSSHCYYPWDAFDYKAAQNRKVYRKNGRTYLWGYDDEHVYARIDVLDILKEVEDKESLFACDARVIHYAVDRFQNGRRRRESGKFEDALVRFTQVIEILCTYRVYQLAGDNQLVNEAGSSGPVPADKRWDLSPLIRLLFGMTVVNLDGVDYWISRDSRLISKDYDYPRVDNIIELIKTRNDFIHFDSPMRQQRTREDACKLEKLAHTFLEKLSSDYCGGVHLPFDTLLELHKFRR